MAFNNNAHRPTPGPKSRRREGLHLRALNVEKGSKRFSSTDYPFPPQTATWRNNLTALSQRRNLLFVAYNHQIYVWEPAGSFQILGSKPEMIITPVMKEPHNGGYISQAFPHAINNILVDDLGREEVLLLVTDSGNVCGYRVEAIFSALKRASEEKEPKPLDSSQVDPFFVEYVEASAWGLAIHKFARLIAVSANTGLITVFAFALVNPASGSADDSFSQLESNGGFADYGQTWLHIRTSDQFAQLRHWMPEKHRTRNIKLSYTGHFTNIPSVSFLNCDLDPNGVWMVSTDIENKLLVWKVWDSLGPFNLVHFNEVTFRTFPDTLRNDSERGWAVIALDPRSFHLLRSTEEACGGQPQRRIKNGNAILDLTKLISRVSNASHLYNYFPPAAKAEPEEPVLPDIFGADCLISTKNGSLQSAVHGVRDPSVPPDPSDLAAINPLPSVSSSFRPSESADTFSHRAVDGSFHEDHLSDDSPSDTDPEPDDQQDASHNELLRALGGSDEHINTPIPPGHGPLTTPEFLQFALLEALGGDVHEIEQFLGESMDHDSTDEDDYLNDQEMDEADDDSDSDSPEVGSLAYQTFDPPANSNFPILHFSQTDIRLVCHPFSSHASVVCGAPLRQPFTHPIVSLRACDRFNMVKYIPEHGIVIAASQKGRAAVIALTESKNIGFSFRIDWIVPFESQEKYGDRPLIPLLGMTVGPMQGFEAPPDVPYIPRNADDNTLMFHYRDTHTHTDSNNDETETETETETRLPSSSSSSSSSTSSTSARSPRRSGGNNEHSSASTPDPRQQQPPLTLPECHARATRAYRPEESWRGWNPSRRYRLLLMFADHTVMSYEFWYTWNSSSDTGDGLAIDEDEYLIV
ncbi:hypothetical protein ARAM_005569 [Aspergillus rambellii]|uniref:Uncharacterized protein n=1 Tax=Aspergillus rambellii TaxID=308745 RepID=A0A0F8XHH1_9EURO|nr:hypothetical protein ARAM_005569 [Aspergillus rambellii]